MEGKVKTDRTIFLDVTVDISPSEVFRLWATVDGIKKFLAPDAKIDPRVGGRYQIIFYPAKDPEGNSYGTNGARVLKLVPDKELAFEWITFAADDLLGNDAPPYAPPAQRSVKPLPTWVEMSFEPIARNRTHIKFAHYGFGQGEKWEQSYHWFTLAWSNAFKHFAEYCRKR